jgi:hypothetical protein
VYWVFATNPEAREDSAMLLASNKQQHKEITKSRKTQQDRQNAQKRTAGKNKDQVGFQEEPHLQNSLQNHSEYSKCWNSKQEFFLIEQPSSPLQHNLQSVAFILQKDKKTDHLRDKELFTTTKPQNTVKLTIDNSQLGMNMRHTNQKTLLVTTWKSQCWHLQSGSWP